jgi:hypothetical protein
LRLGVGAKLIAREVTTVTVAGALWIADSASVLSGPGGTDAPEVSLLLDVQGADGLTSAVHAGRWATVQAFMRVDFGTAAIGQDATLVGAVIGRSVDIGPGAVVTYNNKLACTYQASNDELFICLLCLGNTCTPHCVAEDAPCDDHIGLCGQDNGTVSCPNVGPKNGFCGSDGLCHAVAQPGDGCSVDAACEAAACNGADKYTSYPCAACSGGTCCGKWGAACSSIEDCCDGGQPFGLTCKKKILQDGSEAPSGYCIGLVLGACASSLDCLGQDSICQNGSCVVDPNYCVQTPGGALPGGACVGSCECAPGTCVLPAGKQFGSCKSGAGGPCSSSDDCLDGVSCGCGYCGVPVQPNGALCDLDCECLSGACKAGKCTPSEVTLTSAPLVNAVDKNRMCWLSGTPFLYATSMGPGERCARDEDGNGIDDDVEDEIVRCFAPNFWFTAGEPELQTDEPKVVYNMHRVRPSKSDVEIAKSDLANDLRSRIHINLAVLWRRDGGYHDKHACPRNDHNGDSQGVAMDIDVESTQDSWYAALRRVNADPESEVKEQAGFASAQVGSIKIDNVDETGAHSGAHPVIYASWGKHHWSPGPYEVTDSCLGTNKTVNAALNSAFLAATLESCLGGFGVVIPGAKVKIDVGGVTLALACEVAIECAATFTCFDRTDISLGNGVHRIPTQFSHSPLFFGSAGGQETTGLPAAVAAYLATQNAPETAFFNACAGVSGAAVAAKKLQTTRLNALGYDNHMFAAFTGGLGADQDPFGIGDPPSSVASVLAVDEALFDLDPDADGMNNVDVSVSSHQASNEDLCPATGTLMPKGGTWPSDTPQDVDGDAMVDSCDPDSRYQQRFVGGLTPTLPLIALPRWFVPRAGFLDTDKDIAVDGEDTCPAVGLGDALDPGANYLGEVTNYGPKGELKVGFSGYQLGHMTRGDVCDPYPVAPISYPLPTLDSDCPPAGVGGGATISVGASPIPVTVRTIEGRSANDPDPELGKVKVRGVQLLHCACDPTKGACLGKASNCDASQLKAGVPGQGSGWYRMLFADCDSCDSVALPFVARQTGKVTVLWDWERERKLFPGNWTTTPFVAHAVAGANAAFSSSWAHVIRSLSQVGTAPGLPFGGAKVYAEPEALDSDTTQGLPNVGSLRSERLRSAFGPFSGTVSEPYLVPATGDKCAVIPVVAQQCSSSCTASLFLAHWGATSSSLDGAAAQGGQVGAALLKSGGALADSVIFHPTRGGYRPIALAATLPNWARNGAGRLAILAPQSREVRAVLLGAQAPTAEPDLLWVERTERPRWVWLRAGTSPDRAISYEVVAEGAVGDMVGASATLVTDELGAGAALVDLAVWCHPLVRSSLESMVSVRGIS